MTTKKTEFQHQNCSWGKTLAGVEGAYSVSHLTAVAAPCGSFRRHKFCKAWQRTVKCLSLRDECIFATKVWRASESSGASDAKPPRCCMVKARKRGPSAGLSRTLSSVPVKSGHLDRFPGVSAKLFSQDDDLRRRLNENIVTPDKRFHYRYVAADHAWAAAELMPDNSEETAHVLITAGSWLAGRDPQAADRFYKALIRRCGNTLLGQKAARIKWFPKAVAQTNGQ